MAIHVIREETPDGGAYRALDEASASAGYMTYRYSGDGDMVVEHTKVEDAFGGQGVGQKLAERAVADARQEERKIVPVCSYMRHYLENAGKLADGWVPEK